MIGYGGFVVFVFFDIGRDENGGGNVISVVIIFIVLSVDDINIQVEVFFDVFDVVDYVYVVDVVFVEFVNNGFWWYVDSRDEEFGFGFDDGINEFVELIFCVIVVGILLVIFLFQEYWFRVEVDWLW